MCALARRTLHGELSPLLAPLLLSYGKALFEVAVSQQGVMGKTESNAAEAAAEANEGELHSEAPFRL